MINPRSLKKIAETNAEYPIRLALIERVGGTPLESIQTVKYKGKKITINHVSCAWGNCEKCGERRYYLAPHEKQHRSQGGILSLENTVMLCCDCHRVEQRSEPRLKWIKQEA